MEEINKFNYTTLNIKNFRGINELNINFKENEINKIFGDNGVGKSTILDSITWVLFGKNLEDKKSNFTISPIIDGVLRNDLETDVKLTINNNFIIERIWKNKKTTLKYGYIIDGKEDLITTTQNEFKRILSKDFVDEEEFKALSNINYIPNLKWQDLKELIFNLVGKVNDEDVLNKGVFTHILNGINSFGSKKYFENVKTNDKELTNKIKQLEIEIKNMEDLYGEDIDGIKLNKEKTILENQLQILQDEYKNNQKSVDEIKDLKRSKVILENNIKLYEESYKNLSEVLKNKDLELKQEEIDKYKNEISNHNQLLKDIEIKINEKTKLLQDTKQKEIKIDNSKCSLCGQTLPNVALQKILDNKKNLKQEEIYNINLYISNLKESKKDNEKIIKDLLDKLKKCKEDIENIKNKKYKTEDSNEQKEYKKNIDDNNNQLKKIEEQINKIEKNNKTTKGNDTYINEITNKRKELENINIQLSKYNEQKRIKNILKSKEDELTESITNKQNLFIKLQEIEEFNKMKIDLLKKKIRKNFKLLDFITEEKMSDGTSNETFKLSYKGIPYEDLNQSMKIKISLDLLLGIQNIKDKHICILIDNGEQITTLPNINTQVIITYVKKQEEKKLEVN